MDAYLEQQTRGAFAEHNGNYDDPGATRMWFGKHVGERIDQLDPSYRGWLLKTQLGGPYPHMIRDFEDCKLIDDRLIERQEGVRKSQQRLSIRGVKSPADKSRGGNKMTKHNGWKAPPLSGYFENAQLTSRKASPLTLRDLSRATQAVGDDHQFSRSKASTASKGRGMKASFKAFPPNKKYKKNVNSRQDSSQPLNSSRDDTEAKMASHKRKTDATMNLAGRAFQRVRNRPVVASGTKGPKQRRRTTEPWQSSRRSRESRLPLAPLTAENLILSSSTNQGKLYPLRSDKTPSDTIVVDIASSIEIVAPPPKRRRGGTQVRKEVEAYLWR